MLRQSKREKFSMCVAVASLAYAAIAQVLAFLNQVDLFHWASTGLCLAVVLILAWYWIESA